MSEEGSERYTYEAGTQLPGTPYAVEKRLGAGGMGVVYAVQHTFLKRREALKTIHPELVDRDDIAARMKHEAEVLSSLRHPNIVQVTGGGIIEDRWRLPYFAMEMLSGKTLRELIRRRALTNAESIYIIAYEMLEALAEAHAAGVVHRDVKPENIFLHNDASRTSGPRVSTKLLDFGIMAVLGGRQSRQFRGTFKYASPEQLRGDPVSPQTDLYGAALVIYEMMAGRGPFDDVRDWRELTNAHLQKEPPLLSKFVPVPAALDRLLASALAKHPKRRPESALAFMQQLYVLKEVAANRPLAPVAANTEETLLTAIFPTDEKRPPSSGGIAAAKTKPSPDANREDGPTDKTVEEPFLGRALGETLEDASPPQGMAEETPPSPVALEKTDIDRAVLTRTLESWPEFAAQHGTDPITSNESFDPPGVPDSTRRYLDLEEELAAHLPRSIESSNVTPPPVTSRPSAKTIASDTIVEPPPASTPQRRRMWAVVAVLGIGAIGIGAATLVRRAPAAPAAGEPASAASPVAATSSAEPPRAPAAMVTQSATVDAPPSAVPSSIRSSAPSGRRSRPPKDPAPEAPSVARVTPSAPPPPMAVTNDAPRPLDTPPPATTANAPPGPPASELKRTFKP